MTDPGDAADAADRRDDDDGGWWANGQWHDGADGRDDANDMQWTNTQWRGQQYQATQARRFVWRDEVRDQVAAINAQLGVQAQQVIMLAQDVHNMMQRVAVLENTMQQNTVHVGNMQQRINTMEQTMTARIATVETGLSQRMNLLEQETNHRFTPVQHNMQIIVTRVDQITARQTEMQERVWQVTEIVGRQRRADIRIDPSI